MKEKILKLICLFRPNFIIDDNIPLIYIIYLALRKGRDLLYGVCLFRKKILINPTSIIRGKSMIKFGCNTMIERCCYLDALSLHGITFGDYVSIGKYTTIECTGSLATLGKGLKTGNNVGFGTHGFWGCAGGIEIGNDVIFGNYVSLHSENHNFQDLTTPIRLQGVSHKGIKIGNDCWIGAKVTILDGAIVGDGCIIAAGAVVKGFFPNHCIIGGIPAKILKCR